MKKILVPVDFSGHTDITCTYALELAQKFGAEIRLFHTFFDQFIIADSSFPESIDMSTMYNEELLKEIMHQAEKRLEELYCKLQERIRKEKIENVTLSKSLTGGEIEHEVITICKDYEPDIIVMGTRGEGKNLKIWGKVASYIINHVQVPVMTIPEIKKYMGYSDIMFSADLEDGNLLSCNKILELFKPFKSRIHCVHFLLKSNPEEKLEKMEQMKKSLSGHLLDTNVTFQVINVADEIQKSIDNFIKDNNINLIAFQPHKRSLFYGVFTKAITKKNLFATNIPLLAVPAIQKE
jgi:nucleotide-binding universal stress UspA family protein